MTATQRAAVRHDQDRLLDLIERAGIDETLPITDAAGAPTARQLRPVIYPEWRSVVLRIIQQLERQLS